MSKSVLAVLLLLALLPGRLAAQAVSGTILGIVRDASGAAVANAPVLVTNLDTGASRTVTSNGEGEYQAPSLPPGGYHVSVEMRGFKKTTVAGLQLGVDQKLRADITLEVGAVTETVQVEAETPLIKVDSSELAETVTETQIKDLPLNGRDFVNLTRILPGVQRGIPGANIDGAGSLAWRASASFSANGQRTRDNNFLLDGIDNNETWLNSVVVFPSIDALEEFKVQTSTYSAEFGRSSGGVVNIQIKSGTNNFHGSLFEFLRNDKFDANDWFNNKNGRAKPPFRQNQFGGTYGGRIIRNKTFFFMDYQGWRVRQAQAYVSTVPTAAMKNGDFSALTRIIYDPKNPGVPFTGNRIPAALFDKAAKNILDQLYPEANVPGTVSSNGQVINNFLYNPSQTRNDDQFDVKVDHSFTAKNHAFVRYSFERTERFLPASLPHGDAGFTFGAGTGLVRAQGLAINDTHTISPNLLNEFRFGFSRFAITVFSIDYGQNLGSKVGIPGTNISDTASAGPQIQFPNNEIRNLGHNGNQPLLTFLDTFQYYDNVTWIRGRHTIKAGGNYTRRRRNVFNIDSIVGQFQFNSNLTSNCAGIAAGCNINSTTGFPIASMLLGYPSAENRQFFRGVIGERRPEFGSYIQDDFKIAPRLTINLGLRYDLFVPFVEVHDRQSNFDTSTGKFVIASSDATMNGLHVGRGLQLTPKKDFMPRVGFAYDLQGNGKTVLRGGYGMFYNNPMTGTSSQKSSNPPFLYTFSATTTVLPTLVLSNGLPAIPAVDPNAPPSGGTRSIFDPRYGDGRAQQWNVNIQRQLWRDYLIEVAYAGSKGEHLALKDDINVAPPRVGVTDQNVNRPFIGVAPALRSLSQLESRGWSLYHGLTGKFTKRFSRGVSFVNSFTWAKTLDIVSDTEGATLNPYNFNYDRGVSDYDVPRNFTSSMIYELPFGKNNGAGGGRAKSMLIGGWQVNFILLARSGLPFTVTQVTGLQSTGTGNRPNRIANGRLDNPTPDRWWDLSAFQATSDNTGTFGNSGRNILRQPDQVNTDFAVIKKTKIGERIEHQLRVELFNLVNHPQFATASANTTLGNAQAGVLSSLLFGSSMRQIQLAMKLSF
jgi:Carboxypeptidase regulatory-like domain